MLKLNWVNIKIRGRVVKSTLLPLSSNYPRFISTLSTKFNLYPKYNLLPQTTHFKFKTTNRNFHSTTIPLCFTPQSQNDFLKSFRDREKEIMEDKNCLSVCIFGIPKHYSTSQLKADLYKIPGFSFHKIKRFERSTFAHIKFTDLQEKEKCFPLMVDFKGLGGKKLSISKTEHRKPNTNENHPYKDNTSEEDKKCIVDVTSPWWTTPYEEQLQKKDKYMTSILSRINSESRKLTPPSLYPPWIQSIRDNYPCCPKEEIHRSPITEGYRNKCEFTVGVNRDNKPTVGFLLGSFNELLYVADPSECVVVSKKTLEYRNLFQEYIEKSEYPPYNKAGHTGFWREVLVREFTSGVSVILTVNPHAISSDQLNIEKEKILKYIGDRPNFSLYLRESDSLSNSHTSVTPNLIYGSADQYENLLGYKFRVSPSAFFQVNIKMTEILYSTIHHWAELDKSTVLLDVCCGTGTIGILLSKYVKQVIGLEIEPSAVQDAKFNAKLNEIENISFALGKAEETIANVISKLPNEKIVAIVDPPRGGLHTTVLKALRKCQRIDRIVYVSCNPLSLVSNAAYLCKGDVKEGINERKTFRPVKCTSFDMFPHTDKIEALMLFERDIDY